MAEQLEWWQAEDLCEALILNGGATHSEKAAPRRKRHADGKTVDYKPANDLFEAFDVVALAPDHVRAAQVYAGSGDIRKKRDTVEEQGPWHPYMLVEVWHWRRQECGFTIWRLEDEWEIHDRIEVADPIAELHRADTSLG